MKRLILIPAVCFLFFGMFAQQKHNKFRQLREQLPTPNAFRTASGAPGHLYWQQKADYIIKVRLDDKTQQISGEETITYHNNSPDPLRYLWLQLDQNRRSKTSDTPKATADALEDSIRIKQLIDLDFDFDGGFNVEYVTDPKGTNLNYTINKTMMRVDLPKTIRTGESYTLNIKWWYNINNRKDQRGRSGYEYFEEDDNYLYTIAQFFPRMAVYNDVEGWQNKQFLGRGEFTLEFGDYEVEITVPGDHLVAATGKLMNPVEVLSKKEIYRYEDALKSYDQPVLIVTPEEALKKEKTRDVSEKTWKFRAKNVRDFAFASSRKFIWDAMAVAQNDRSIMAMSMYPKEGNPLWEKYSTKAVAHTLKWYSHYTFEYPYPVAWSIHTDRIGMEYPMICFNGGRPESDGTYTKRTKYGMISVIIHEVGHNYFPMIVNSDERQWTWMDEGLNTFLQFLTEQQWERDYPSRRGPAFKIVDYMKSPQDQLSPVMTNSESLMQFGNNAYAKPATALNILRETIMGRELFDFAFKEYANRWKFKQPEPADFFRTMEDASAVDLDWFWRGWFFTTENVDISLSGIKWFRPDKNKMVDLKEYINDYSEENPMGISGVRNKVEIDKTQDEIDPGLRDFYSNYDPEELAREEFSAFFDTLTVEGKSIIKQNKNYYEFTFENIGGLLMPLILEIEFEDSTKQLIRLPPEIWRKNNETVTKVISTEKIMKQVVLDPYLETADVDRSNNYYPSRQEFSRFELYEQKEDETLNPMQRAKIRNKKKGT
jgi:hypothetical protein